MLTSEDHLPVFRHDIKFLSLGCKGMFSLAGSLQTTDVIRQVLFLLFLPCMFVGSSSAISSHKTWEMSRPFILLFQNNATSSALRASWLPCLFLAITLRY